MRSVSAALALSIVLGASGLAIAQETGGEPRPSDAPLLVIEDGDPFGPGDFAVRFGRPATFDNLRLDVRENLRPPEQYGPGNQAFCSPSIPDC